MGFAWLLFSTPPAGVQVPVWHFFLGFIEIGGLVVAVVVSGLVLALYKGRCERRKIVTHTDYFASFSPLRARRWTVATFVIVLVGGALYWWLKASRAGFLEGLAPILLVSIVDTLGTAALVHFGLPSFTPPKYRYRVPPFPWA